MSTIVVFGATGFAGGRISAELTSRGHRVVGVSRSASGPGMRAGSVFDDAFVREVATGADTIVVALRAVTDGEPDLIEALPSLLAASESAGARLGWVGGAGSLAVAADGPRLVDGPDFPDAFKPEALSHARILETLRETDTPVDWFYISPAQNFGAHAPGERTGHFRVGGEVLLRDADGVSAISGDDYAIGFADEVEHPAHHRQRLSLAY